MKIKVKFEFEAELPKGLWWMAYGDWGDEDVSLMLKQGKDDLTVAVVVNTPRGNIRLKTECTGQEVIEIIPDLNT